ncbi:hypothetical protein TWF730_007307 [Orbilia blumenaviensis]|uniref:Uncharacterized protein n=1 Tax=Orbilia blumenaviensis TaxID=1796055 RepID=A0AAV9VAN6_9PEZI
MFLPEALLGLFVRLILIRGVEGNPRNIAVAVNTSATDTRPLTTAAADSCCFIIQDRIDDYYWRRYTFTVTETVYAVTTHVSVYSTGKVTNIETNTITRVNPAYRPPKGEFYESIYRNDNPLRAPRGNRPNKAPGVEVQSTQLVSKDGTKYVAGGTTVFSPSAFNIYNSFKIITVPPVTDSNGNAACATISWNPYNPELGMTGSRSFTGINSYAQAYYNGLGSCFPDIITYTETIEDNGGGTGTTTKTSVATGKITLDCSFTSTGGVEPSVVTEIKLTKPYVRIAPASETVTFSLMDCAIESDAPQEMWGYFPQDVLDDIKADPYYRSLYPDITKCLPGGPQIFPRTIFFCEVPHVLDPRVTLTSYEEDEITIGSEFFPTTGGAGSRTREPAQVDTTTTASPSDNDPVGSARPNPTNGQPTETNPPSTGTPSDSLPVDEPPSSQSLGPNSQNPTSDSSPGQPSDTVNRGPGNTDLSSLSTATTNPGSGGTTGTPTPEPPNNSGANSIAPQYFFQLAGLACFLVALITA